MNTVSNIHVGSTVISFFQLLRGKHLINSYYFRFLSKQLNINLLHSDLQFNSFIKGLCIFDDVTINNFNLYSNVSGYFEFGINSDSYSPTSCNNSLSYYYKTETVNSSDNFFLYQGNYLPVVETNNVFTYLFMPSANQLEVEDSYINIFGDLQISNQVLDFSEKEEVKSDFYILKNIFFNFFYAFTKSNNVSFFYSFDHISGELVHYYFSYFVLTFDCVPYLANYNKNTNILCTRNSFFFSIEASNLISKNSFFANYSKTLRTFNKLKSTKESNFLFK